MENINNPKCALSILYGCLGATEMVYSLRCNTPSEEVVNSLEEFDSLPQTTFENILGTPLSNESWHQASLPINKTGTGIRRAYNWPCIDTAYNWPSLTADHILTKVIDELNGLSI